MTISGRSATWSGSEDTMVEQSAQSTEVNIRCVITLAVGWRRRYALNFRRSESTRSKRLP